MYHPGSTHRPDSLIKQTYSTTMTHPVTGKVKKFHVVAYSSKVRILIVDVCHVNVNWGLSCVA